MKRSVKSQHEQYILDYSSKGLLKLLAPFLVALESGWVGKDGKSVNCGLDATHERRINKETNK